MGELAMSKVQHIAAKATMLSRIWTAVKVTVLAALVLSMIYPLLFMIFTALKTPTEFTFNFWLPPAKATLENIRRVWFDYHFNVFFRNSLIVSILGTIFPVCLGTLGGYAFARLRVPLANFFFYIILGMLFIPLYIYLIPLFVQMKNLHLTNNLWNLIMVYTFFNLPTSTYVMRSFFLTIHHELEEQALIDGASQWQVFVRIMAPLSAATFSSICIIAFLSCWGEYLWASVSNIQPQVKTMPVALSMFTTSMNVFWWYQMAALTLATVPSVLIYISFQRFFERGLTEGALKE
jgi:ABC-type glycerol-3-phosphate transport system permease component